MDSPYTMRSNQSHSFDQSLSLFLKRPCHLHKDTSILTVCFHPTCLKDLTCFLCSICHNKHPHKDTALPYYSLFSPNLIDEVSSTLRDHTSQITDFTIQHGPLIDQINNFYDQLELSIILILKSSRSSTLQSLMQRFHPKLSSLELLQHSLQSFQTSKAALLASDPDNIPDKTWQQFLNSFYSLYNSQISSFEVCEKALPSQQVHFDLKQSQIKDYITDFKQNFNQVIKSMQNRWFPELVVNEELSEDTPKSLTESMKYHTRNPFNSPLKPRSMLKADYSTPLKLNTSLQSLSTSIQSCMRTPVKSPKHVRILSSVKKISKESWESLGVFPELIDCLQKKDFKVPTTSQAATIKLLKKNPKCIGCVQSAHGPGKVISYAVPILQMIDMNLSHLPHLESRGKKNVMMYSPQALILAHNQEAANNIYKVLLSLVEHEPSRGNQAEDTIKESIKEYHKDPHNKENSKEPDNQEQESRDDFSVISVLSITDDRELTDIDREPVKEKLIKEHSGDKKKELSPENSICKDINKVNESSKERPKLYHRRNHKEPSKNKENSSQVPIQPTKEYKDNAVENENKSTAILKGVRLCTIKPETLQSIKQGGHIMIITPSMLKYIMDTPRSISIQSVDGDAEDMYTSISFRNTKIIVVDDADELAIMEYRNSLSIMPEITQKLYIDIPILFMAGNLTNRLTNLVEENFSNRKVISKTIKREKLALSRLKHLSMEVTLNQKHDLITSIFMKASSVKQGIIFVNSLENAEELGYRLRQTGIASKVMSRLHCGDERDEILNEFLEGKTSVIVSDTLLPKGFDYKGVSFVVNADPPLFITEDYRELPDSVGYLLRVGRTGKYDLEGITLNMITGKRQKQVYEDVARYFGLDMVEVKNVKDVETAMRDMMEISKQNQKKLRVRGNKD